MLTFTLEKGCDFTYEVTLQGREIGRIEAVCESDWLISDYLHSEKSKLVSSLGEAKTHFVQYIK